MIEAFRLVLGRREAVLVLVGEGVYRPEIERLIRSSALEGAVLLTLFSVAGTLEERINAIVEGKQNLADTIVGSGEQWLTELSTEQLRDLLTLRREMLDEL